MDLRSSAQKLAFTLMGLGGLTLVGYGFYSLFRFFVSESTIPLAIRVAIPVVIVGFLVLFAVVLWDRIRKRRTEKFEGIEDE